MASLVQHHNITHEFFSHILETKKHTYAIMTIYAFSGHYVLRIFENRVESISTHDNIYFVFTKLSKTQQLTPIIETFLRLWLHMPGDFVVKDRDDPYWWAKLRNIYVPSNQDLKVRIRLLFALERNLSRDNLDQRNQIAYLVENQMQCQGFKGRCVHATMAGQRCFRPLLLHTIGRFCTQHRKVHGNATEVLGQFLILDLADLVLMYSGPIFVSKQK